MTTGALAVFLAGAIAASVEWFGPARGGKLLMQALTGAILVAALAWIWWRYRRNRGRGRPA